MIVRSTEFQNNGMMPKKYTGFGDDLSPAFQLDKIPENTISIAIIMDDLDVPLTREFTHWIIWNISPDSNIPEGIPGGREINYPISAVQGSAWGKHIYRGPKQPPFIRKAHRYRFSVYALDAMLDISADSNKTQLVQAMAGHIIKEANLIGIYDPSK